MSQVAKRTVNNDQRMEKEVLAQISAGYTAEIFSIIQCGYTNICYSDAVLRENDAYDAEIGRNFKKVFTK